MIQGIVVKKIIEVVMKAILKKYNLDKVTKYVEEDNELDIQIKQLQKTTGKYGKYIEEIEKDVGQLKTDSHPPIKNLEKRLKYLERKIK
jgi:predicted RNase H-like nuclease (RuvC/YqgF family)